MQRTPWLAALNRDRSRVPHHDPDAVPDNQKRDYLRLLRRKRDRSARTNGRTFDHDRVDGHGHSCYFHVQGHQRSRKHCDALGPRQPRNGQGWRTELGCRWIHGSSRMHDQSHSRRELQAPGNIYYNHGYGYMWVILLSFE